MVEYEIEVVYLSGRFDAFFALEPEKQRRILDAGLGEFAEKGFRRASTNAIAETARIGKGMLFYYFGSKGEFFDFLCEYCIEFFPREYLDRFNPQKCGGDFILRQQYLAGAKRRAMEENPLIFAMLESFYRPENAPYVKKYGDVLAEQRRAFADSLYEGLDLTLFRADIEPKRAVRYIAWLMDAYAGALEARLKADRSGAEYEAALREEWEGYDVFIEDLRHLFYT